MSENNINTKSGGRRIVLTAVGSLGDLHPYLAIARELARRGHRPVVATLPIFRERVEGAGLEFHPIRAATLHEPSPEQIARVFRGTKGIEFLLKELILPALRTAYEDTCAISGDADLLISHPLTMATRLVAKTRGLPWVTTQLAPMSMLSAHDPPVLPHLGWLRRVGPPNGIWRVLFRMASRRTRPWVREYDDLRVQLGVPDSGNPLFEGGHSPALELALFSPLFGPPQPDWPPSAVATGFPFFEQDVPADRSLEAWLAAGSAPVVFTLGSSAVMTPGDFFRESEAAARTLGIRALLLGAKPEGFQSPGDTPACGGDQNVFVCGYGSYARIFPRAAAVVHQGGIGTTAEALRAGRPMLVVPFGTDQPDNAARVARLGVGRFLGRRRYRAARVAKELRTLLEQPGYAQRASQVGSEIRAENGAATACDALQRLLGAG